MPPVRAAACLGTLLASAAAARQSFEHEFYVTEAQIDLPAALTLGSNGAGSAEK
jgi:hypothetical protein